MHMAIDILAAIFLLFFFLAGWHKGFLLSVLGVVRVVLAYGAAYFAGRHIGFWLAEAAHRPRIVTIPVIAGLTFMLITFFFYIVMSDMRARQRKKEKEENLHRPLFSCFIGSAINLAGGVLSLVLLFWLADLFMVGATGTAIPGADKAYFSRFARRTVFEVAHFIIPEKDNGSQVSAMARMISNPADGMQILEEVMAADSVQQLATDQQNNASVQQLFNDRATLENLRELGMVSGTETKSGLCERLSAFGQNEKIRASIESLNARQLLSPDKITLLIRDPAFDTILAELLR